MAACWASWVDALPMIRARHPHVADEIVLALTRNRPAFHLQGANACRRHTFLFVVFFLWNEMMKSMRHNDNHKKPVLVNT